MRKRKLRARIAQLEFEARVPKPVQFATFTILLNRADGRFPEVIDVPFLPSEARHSFNLAHAGLRAVSVERSE